MAEPSLPLIDLRGVVKTYSTAAGEFTALKGISVQVAAGEFLGVLGKSGAGKSTLLNMITGVDDLTTGEVVVRTNGSAVSVHELDEDVLALWRGQTLGIVYQSFQLLPMLTLLENVMLPIDYVGLYDFDERPKRALWLGAVCGSLSTRAAGGTAAQPSLNEAMQYVPPA